MDNKVNYTVIGVVGFLLIAAFIITVFCMTTMRHRAKYNNYVSYFHQEVVGLQKESLVRYNGIEVGYIYDVKMDPNNLQDVIIYYHVRPEVAITTSTVAVIESEGFTGGKYIGLKSTKSKAPKLTLKKGQDVIVIPTQLSMMGDLESTLKGVAADMKKTIVSLNKLLGPTNRQSIQRTLKNTEKITQVIANNSKKINQSLASVQKILKNTSVASNKLPAMIDQVQEALKAFEGMADSLDKTGDHASVAMNKASTTIQNISDQLVPNAQQLLEQITQIMPSIKQLSDELAQNPGVLLRGTEPPAPGPGEKRS